MRGNAGARFFITARNFVFKRNKTMKRSITLSFTTLSLLLSLVSLPAPVHATPRPPRFRADSGVVTLGPAQKLRVTVAAGDINGDNAIRVRLRWMQYAEQTCSGMPTVCRHMVTSQSVTPVEALGDEDAVSLDLNGAGIGGTGAVRVVIESDSPNTRVRGIVFDTSTQRIVAICTFIPD